MPDDIPAQPLLVEIASEPRSNADQSWLAQRRDLLAPRELSRVGGEALALPITSDHPVADHSLRLTVEIAGVRLALA
jgi:hypothetical protein